MTPLTPEARVRALLDEKIDVPLEHIYRGHGAAAYRAGYRAAVAHAAALLADARWWSSRPLPDAPAERAEPQEDEFEAELAEYVAEKALRENRKLRGLVDAVRALQAANTPDSLKSGTQARDDYNDALENVLAYLLPEPPR